MAKIEINPDVDVSVVSASLLLELNAYSDKIQTPIFINHGTDGIHVENSEHYGGLAVDILFPEKELWDLPNLLLDALRFKFMGIGIYNAWKYHGKIIGGMHLDIRDAPYKNLWIGVEGDYKPMTIDNIKLYFL